MSPTPRELVARFYAVVWDKADEAEARKILAPDFRFRASLGPELRGPDGFIVYLRAVHAALANFTCTIEELIVAENSVAARMSFHGIHRGKFFGIAPTGRTIRWSGAAFFKTKGAAIAELWVLGDIEAVRRQLAPGNPIETFSV